jgi:hypothetical protein
MSAKGRTEAYFLAIDGPVAPAKMEKADSSLERRPCTEEEPNLVLISVP